MDTKSIFFAIKNGDDIDLDHIYNNNEKEFTLHPNIAYLLAYKVNNVKMIEKFRKSNAKLCVTDIKLLLKAIMDCHNVTFDQYMLQKMIQLNVLYLVHFCAYESCNIELLNMFNEWDLEFEIDENIIILKHILNGQSIEMNVLENMTKWELWLAYICAYKSNNVKMLKLLKSLGVEK